MAVLRRNQAARLLDLLADGPFIVPGTVRAVAHILVFLPPLPVIGVSIYGTATILLLAYLARFLPLVLRPCAAALASLEQGLDEAGRMVGAGPLRRLAFIVAPLAAPAAMAGAVLVFMTAFNELTVSTLLWSSGVETVGVTIFSLQYEGNSTGAATLFVLSIAIVLALALAIDRAHGLMPRGTLPGDPERRASARLSGIPSLPPPLTIRGMPHQHMMNAPIQPCGGTVGGRYLAHV